MNEFLVEIPKLCEREDDIAIFANHFLEKTNRELNKKILGIRSEAMKLLFEHKWPGNVRELKNTIRRAVLMAGTNQITPADILFEKAECDPGTGPGSIRVDEERVNDVLEGTLSLKEMTNQVASEIEKEVIRKVLLKTGGNKSRAAKTSQNRTRHPLCQDEGVGNRVLNRQVVFGEWSYFRMIRQMTCKNHYYHFARQRNPDANLTCPFCLSGNEYLCQS